MTTLPTKPVAKDWYACKLADCAWKATAPRQPLASAWGGRPKRGDPARDLLEVRTAVRNLARIQGVPPNCQIELAAIGQAGAGAAGFKDAPNSFEQPYILLDKAPYEACAPTEMLDVYCGIGLHEAGHILHSREGYRRANSLTPLRRVFENLWEDERIEKLVADSSPGFAGYLESARRALLDGGELGQAIRNWDALPDLDKVNALCFAFVRRPHLIAEAMRRWTAVNGECVFDSLRALAPVGPRNEADVAALSGRMEELAERLRKLYQPDNPKGDGPQNQAPGQTPPNDDISKRLQRQRQADEDDRAAAPPPAAKPAPPPPPAKRSSPLEVVRRWLRGKKADKGKDKTAPRPAAAPAPKSGGKKPADDERRFGLTRMERSLGRFSRVTRPLSEADVKGVVRVVRRHLPEDCWDWDGSRKTEVQACHADLEARKRYEEARRHVREHIAAMRAVFAQRLRERTWFETERSDGLLHPRRLARALTTDRIFRRKHPVPQRGIALCLLLDESGSMGQGPGSRAATALQVAVLIVEALRGLPGVELEVYSHTSCGESEKDCLVRHLHGRRNTELASLGCYAAGRENYDHQAINTVARLFEKSTEGKNRMLLVLSDGSPAGRGYGGEPAIQATREAVESVRRRGMRVLNVAIADHRSEAIYGARHTVKYTDLTRLVTDMRRLVTSIVRRAVEGR